MLLSASGLSLKFASAVETVVALDEVSITLSPGDLLGLYGASGSGKTSLLHVLAGLRRPDSGDVRVGDVNLAQLDANQRSALRLQAIGVVFQDSNLIDEFTVLENVALPLEARGVKVAAAHHEALDKLRLVNMGQLAHRMPIELSGGQRQRVGVARALVGDRRIIVADEPTGALDSENSRSLFKLLRELADNGCAVVVASHDPSLRDYATRSMSMVDGRVSEDTMRRTA